ncbi:MAG: hypothetical protein IPN62_17720 [Flavobacteriales bacterium]|nr:hypothetical protein [Flavobacteriales bacterium]
MLTSGITYSSNGIATSAHQNLYNAQYDAYLVKMNAAGVRQWATYRAKQEVAQDMPWKPDTAGNVVLRGGISGGGMVATGGAFKPASVAVGGTRSSTR